MRPRVDAAYPVRGVELTVRVHSGHAPIAWKSDTEVQIGGLPRQSVHGLRGVRGVDARRRERRVEHAILRVHADMPAGVLENPEAPVSAHRDGVVIFVECNHTVLAEGGVDLACGPTNEALQRSGVDELSAGLGLDLRSLRSEPTPSGRLMAVRVTTPSKGARRVIFNSTVVVASCTRTTSAGSSRMISGRGTPTTSWSGDVSASVSPPPPPSVSAGENELQDATAASAHAVQAAAQASLQHLTPTCLPR